PHAAGRAAERGIYFAVQQMQRGGVPHGSRHLGRSGISVLSGIDQRALLRRRRRRVQRRAAHVRQVRHGAGALPDGAGGLAALRAVRRAGQPRARQPRGGGETLMSLERKKTLNVFKEAPRAWGSYDDFPVGPAGTDPMPHLSRNRLPQPFYLVSETDQVLIQMAGRGEIEFMHGQAPRHSLGAAPRLAPLGSPIIHDAPERMTLVPGDTVYLPAGLPSRLIPDGENLQLRLKAEPPVREAVVWYCPRCAGLVHTRELAVGIV